MQSFNFPTYKFGVASITDEAPAFMQEQAQRFLIHQPGLSGHDQTVSFEFSDSPGHYLRHMGSYLNVDLKDEITSDLENTATFKIHKDLMQPGYFTFEALAQPGFYIRHANARLRVHQLDNSNLFKADSSFRFLEGPFLMESENTKHVIGIDQSNHAYIKEHSNQGLKLNLVHPSLTSLPGTVSLESDESPRLYLRHYNYQVDLEDRSNPRNSSTFDQDASFKLCTKGCSTDGYKTLEAGYLPNYFLRHLESRVVISPAEDQESFWRDARFTLIGGKLSISTI